MKNFLLILLFVLGLTAAQAAPPTTTFVVTQQTVVIPASGYVLSFGVNWFCADTPRSSVPGRVELCDAGGSVVGSVTAVVHQSTGTSLVASLGFLSDVVSWMAGWSADGAPADGGLVAHWHITGVPAGSYTLRFYEYTTWQSPLAGTTVWTETSFQDGWAEGVPPTIVWTAAPAAVASGQSYSVTAHGHDADGNLTQVNVWKNGATFALAGGGNGTDGDAGTATADAGPQSLTFTAQAVDATGATSSLITHVVSVAAPVPPPQYDLATGAGAGGTVSPGGSWAAGSTVAVTATADATHDFLGWSGDAGGTANPLAVLLDRPKAVQANFSPKLFALATSATLGGSVTPGGSYPYGTRLTLAGVPDATHRFSHWTGDASGSAPSISVWIDRALWVQAVFTDKLAQTIAFAPLANRPLGAPPHPLDATASSGLPVSYVVVSGPAQVSGGVLTITGPGAITIQANQGGDADYLPAPGVTQTFSAVTAASLKYQAAAHTLLQAAQADGLAPFVLENP